MRAGQCDMDKDAIPDMCDSDIDGDTAPNPLGIILYEKPDCSYGPDNTLPPDTGLPTTGSADNPLSPFIAVYDGCPFVHEIL